MTKSVIKRYFGAASNGAGKPEVALDPASTWILAQALLWFQ